MNSALVWLFFNVLSLVVTAFFSMMEMACVSFNKVRLQYYVSKKMTRAIWLNELLQHPAYLFGSTLLGVNLAMFIGSECSRRFYMAIGINPDFAPLTQVFIVVIFAELAPMFAARRYSEHVALLGIPVLYTFSKIIHPILLCLGWVVKATNRFFPGAEDKVAIFPTQEELQKILEDQDEELVGSTETLDPFRISQIFTLRNKEAKQLMEPLEGASLVPSSIIVKQLRDLLKKKTVPYMAMYHREKSNIIGIVFPKDLVMAQENHRVKDFARTPWFVTQNTHALQILRQFRRNQQQVAVILNDKGQAMGFLSLDDIVEEIIGKLEHGKDVRPLGLSPKMMIVERTVSGEMSTREFETKYGVNLSDGGDLTLSQYITKHKGHIPEIGETYLIPPFELTVKEISLTEIKSFTLKTKL